MAEVMPDPSGRVRGWRVHAGNKWSRRSTDRLSPWAGTPVLRKCSGRLCFRVAARALYAIETSHHGTMPIHESSRAIARPMGSGPHGREDVELRVGEAESRRQMRLPGVDGRRPSATRELRGRLRRQGSARSGAHTMSGIANDDGVDLS
jgi:hypothetical protein